MRVVVKVLSWAVRLLLLGVFFLFALNNLHVVKVQGLFGLQADMRLVVALGLAALLGVVLGVSIVIPRLFRYRQERNALHDTLHGAAPQVDGASEK